MDEKKFSMIILVFVFMVAIPSMVYLFSDAMTGQAYVASKKLTVFESMPKFQTNYGLDPNPYRTGRGVSVQQRIGEIYKTAEVPDRVFYDQTYSAMKIENCPYGCTQIKDLTVARDYQELGRDIIYGENAQGQKVACACSREGIYESII